MGGVLGDRDATWSCAVLVEVVGSALTPVRHALRALWRVISPLSVALLTRGLWRLATQSVPLVMECRDLPSLGRDCLGRDCLGRDCRTLSLGRDFRNSSGSGLPRDGTSASVPYAMPLGRGGGTPFRGGGSIDSMG
jgi:hypothetical protein